MTAAAWIATALLAVVTVFQVALAAGAPWGAAAWGGQHEGVLPVRLRVASGVVAVVVYPLLALTVLASAGAVERSILPTGATPMWVLTGFFVLGTLGNAASRSPVERLWAVVTLALAVCCGVIAGQA